MGNNATKYFSRNNIDADPDEYIDNFNDRN